VPCTPREPFHRDVQSLRRGRPPDEGSTHAGRPGSGDGPPLERRWRPERARLRARRPRPGGDLPPSGRHPDRHLIADALALSFKGVEPFLEFMRLSKPSASSALRMPLFLARHPAAIGALRANLGALKPPPSFAAIDYYALHAFRWIDADGGDRYVRYAWRHTVDLPALERGEAKRLGRDYPPRGDRNPPCRWAGPLRARGSRSPAPATTPTTRRACGPKTASGSSSASSEITRPDQGRRGLCLRPDPGHRLHRSYRMTPSCFSAPAPTRSRTTGGRPPSEGRAPSTNRRRSNTVGCMGEGER